MGDVYRADDMTLGQSVALKFLPSSAIAIPGWLERFRSEVRLTRQISHQSVCRVYDIAELDGRVFLSMEFVDGEDLSSLLRRIGRLPSDKAVEIARQICFGVAAAHDQGVIHRDLKPANIMLDGRGHARVMDFGIAGFAAELTGPGAASAGTPAYMAPEQLEGREVTRRSDIYALGLVLYELFTGKPAFQASSLAELRASRADGTRPTAPSDVVHDLDPAVERVILRCLEHDPQKRPPSAVAVAAALPGGDPLAAALAAGETPSPELVAASGEEGTLTPRIALALGAAALALLLLVVVLRDRLSLLRFVPLESSPEVLASRARAALASLGYDDHPPFVAYGFSTRTALLSAIRREDDSPQRWEKLRDPALTPLSFWYRTSDSLLKPDTWFRMDTSVDDPAPRNVGESVGVFTTDGMLRSFIHIASVREVRDQQAPRDPASQPSAPERTAKPFPAAIAAAMGLDETSLAPLQPDRLYAAPCDQRAAFKTMLPGGDPVPVTVEAGLVRGKVMGLETTYPWSFPPSVQSSSDSWSQVASIGQNVIQVSLLFSAIALCLRNYRSRRSDRRGAWRVAGLAFVLSFTSCAFLATWSLQSMDSLLGTPLVRSVYFAAIWWMFYTAIEPTVRKRSPHSIVSWSRLLEGRWNDPLVGRDVLIGVLAGLAVLLIQEPAAHLIASLTGAAPPDPVTPNVSALTSARLSTGQAIDAVRTAIAGTLLVSLGVVVLRGIVRHRFAVVGVLWLVFFVMSQVGVYAGVTGGLFLGAAWSALLTAIFLRLGVLGTVAAVVTALALMRVPATLDFSKWYAFAGVPTVLALLAIIALSVRSALGKHAVFTKPLFDV